MTPRRKTKVFTLPSINIVARTPATHIMLIIGVDAQANLHNRLKKTASSEICVKSYETFLTFGEF
jgi:hypothetical protein